MVQSMRSTSFEAEYLTASQELYRWLIQPATQFLDRQSIKTLVFILDGSLRNVPIAALHDGQQYLVENYAIALTPSLQLMNPRSLPKNQLNALLGGLSKENQGSIALPGVEEEILKIKAQVNATVLENEDFTSNRLQQKLQTKPFSIVHLATHGQFSSTAQETFIQTWNGRIDVDDLRSYLSQDNRLNNIPIELLVLSACQTAQGDNRAALGMAGVAIRSGARSTLASLWAINDVSTTQFMTQFYYGLTHDRRTRAESVRQGLTAIPLPKASPGLSNDRSYHWTVALVCNPKRRTEDWVTGGWIQRQKPSDRLQQTLNQNSNLIDQATSYLQANFWYDALTQAPVL